MAPAGQRSINAFFKAPAIATSVVRKPAASVPAEDAESKGVAESADPLVEDPSTNGGGRGLAARRLSPATRGDVQAQETRGRRQGRRDIQGRREGRVQG